MTRPIRTLALAALCFFFCASARAEKWALLIGINHYEDVNSIASLGAADTDARELKKTLKSQLGFPEANITLLVSDGDKKPTRANILEALGELGENARPGDTVFVFYSGHGIEVGGKSCLLPYDFRGKSKFAGVETALEVSKFKSLLSEVKSKALIMVWDMCRNDPFANAKGGDSKRNILSDTKGWQLTALTPRGTEAPVIANFFACSSGETSFEWTDKNRGYFTYFLEQGMRGEAADASGNITLDGLAKYVQTRVAKITKNNESQAQNPMAEFGSGGQFVLATGKANPNVEIPVAVKPISGGGVKTLSTRTTLTFSGQPTGATILVDKVAVKGGSWTTNLVEPTKDVEVAITAPGFEPKVVAVTLERGKAATIDARLATSEAEKPADPKPDPGVEPGKVPPPVVNNASGPLGEVLRKIRTAHNVGAVAGMAPLKFYGAGAAALANLNIKYENIFGVLSPGNDYYRVEYVERGDSAAKKVAEGFDGQKIWKTGNGKPEETKPDDRFFDNPVGPLFYALTASSVTLNEKFSKPRDPKPYLSATDPLLGDFKIVFDPTTFQVVEISLKRSGIRPVFKYQNYRMVGRVPIPHTVVGDTPIGAVTYTYSRVEPNAPFAGSYFSGR